MAVLGNGQSLETAQGEFADSRASGARDLLSATIALGASSDATPTSADVIDYPLGRAAAANPVGGVCKRAFDLTCATAILVLAAPLLASVALATKLQGNGPIVFAHKRVGFRGHEFDCLKFRTMVADADKKLEEHLAANPNSAAEWARDQKLREDPRVTRIGHLLRKTSLDELPQLFNVLRGDMSLVGPRPVVADELPRYGKHRTSYLSARPGMTGLWQVSGRNSTTYERRIELDASYVKDWAFTRDVMIILRTIPEMILSSRAF